MSKVTFTISVVCGFSCLILTDSKAMKHNAHRNAPGGDASYVDPEVVAAISRAEEFERSTKQRNSCASRKRRGWYDVVPCVPAVTSCSKTEQSHNFGGVQLKFDPPSSPRRREASYGVPREPGTDAPPAGPRPISRCMPPMPSGQEEPRVSASVSVPSRQQKQIASRSPSKLAAGGRRGNGSPGIVARRRLGRILTAVGTVQQEFDLFDVGGGGNCGYNSMGISRLSLAGALRDCVNGLHGDPLRYWVIGELQTFLMITSIPMDRGDAAIAGWFSFLYSGGLTGLTTFIDEFIAMEPADFRHKWHFTNLFIANNFLHIIATLLGEDIVYFDVDLKSKKVVRGFPFAKHDVCPGGIIKRTGHGPLRLFNVGNHFCTGTPSND